VDREAARIAKLLNRVGSDIDAPAELLGIAAEYLKARKPLPDALADYLANAFRRAAGTPETDDGQRVEDARIARLAHALGMTRNEGRPRADVSRGGIAVAIAAFGDDVSESRLASAVAETYRVGKSTARTRIKEAKAKIAEGRALLERK